MKLARWRASAAIAFSFLALLASVQPTTAAENPVHWTIEGVPRKPLAPGASFTANLVASIDPGWHLYALEQNEGGPSPLEVTAAGNPPPLQLGTVQASKPIRLRDPNFDQIVNLYVDKAKLRLPLTVSPTASAGAQQGGIQIRYQCCNATMCLPPRTSLLDLPIVVRSSN